jgi:hypothetical protein
MFKFLGTLALGLAVAGSAHAAGQRYPTEFVVAAVRACADAMSGVPRSTATAYCSCVIDGLQAKYKLGEAIDLLGQIKGTSLASMPQPLRPIIGACVVQAASGADTDL